ncbi:hypothetical protein ABI59_17210 [Acidobacteria bacterium Mor1]|nr:hypothetical protein ABI59_17210 [Acidobacteria bacterium Mor1]
MKKSLLGMLRDERGAALVEYGLLVAGVALIASAAVSMMGHKTNDLVGTVAAVLPGAHADDNAPILSGKLIETLPQDADGDAATPDTISLNITNATEPGILENSETERLGSNLGLADGQISSLIVEP